MLAWEEIMQNAPTMKKIVEDKVVEEVAKKQVEIDQLKQENANLQTQVDELTVLVGDMMLGGTV